MKRILLFVVIMSSMFCLSACHKEPPQEEKEARPVTAAPITPNSDSEESEYSEQGTYEAPAPRPMTTDEVSSIVIDNIATDFMLVANGYDFPQVKPNDEDSIIELRAWMQMINELELSIQFDTANLGMSDYGYCLNLDSPTDYWGSPVCLWVQDTTAGRQIAIAAAGADGIFTYQGYGPDYSSTGFGDDQVKPLDIS